MYKQEYNIEILEKVQLLSLEHSYSQIDWFNLEEIQVVTEVLN